MRPGARLGRCLLPLAARPDLWPSAVLTAATLVPRRWWGRAPYLPLPDRRWLAFRLETAYGDPEQLPEGDDLLAYLAWASAERRAARSAAAPTLRASLTGDAARGRRD